MSNFDKTEKHPRARNKFQGKTISKDGKKLCATCESWKPLSEYDKRPDRPLGVRSKCKTCSIEYRKHNMETYKLIEYKNGAKRRGFDFDLSKEDFQTLWQKPCFYCADEIETIGLDRIDSNIGYRLDNVVPCCAICNTMKLALPREVFIAHCYKIIKNQT